MSRKQIRKRLDSLFEEIEKQASSATLGEETPAAMPAREETYRSTRTLHIVFAITSVLMTISIVWMVLVDHLRPWKSVQREFQEIEVAKLRAQERQKLDELRQKHQAQIDALDQAIAESERLSRERRRELKDLEARIKRIEGQFQQLDTRRRFKKAELDQLRGFFLANAAGEKTARLAPPCLSRAER